MKNQYFGDRRDLFKYDLLLDLADRQPQPRITFIPMLTPNDDSAEGNVHAYECGARRQRLFNALQTAVRAGNRDIRLLRELIPQFGVEFLPYRDGETFDDRVREEYFSAIPSDCLANAIVFLDPDIGLQTGTFGYMRRSGIDKYLMYADLSSLAARATDDSAFVVYQHLQKDATKRANDVERRLRELSAHLGTGFVWALQWADLAFLIAVRDGRTAARIRSAVGAHADRHGLALFDGSFESAD